VQASTLSVLGNLGDDNALKIGFNSGLMARYRFNDWLAFKTGVAYQQKGERIDESVTKNEIKTSLSYLVVPVKAEFSAGEKAGLKHGRSVFFATGPFYGYLLDAKQTVSGNTTDLNGMNDTDFGWNFELGFEFPVMKTNALQVSLNYEMGFSDIADGMDSQNKTASLNLVLIY
jgi:long-subunit fatty acid transport protein